MVRAHEKALVRDQVVAEKSLLLSQPALEPINIAKARSQKRVKPRVFILFWAPLPCNTTSIQYPSCGTFLDSVVSILKDNERGQQDDERMQRGDERRQRGDEERRKSAAALARSNKKEEAKNRADDGGATPDMIARLRRWVEVLGWGADVGKRWGEVLELADDESKRRLLADVEWCIK